MADKRMTEGEVSCIRGVSLEQAREASALELAVTGDLSESRLPSDEGLRLISEVLDPNGVRKSEFR